MDDDGIDNDNDGYVDESWTDGIDNDGDWRPDEDDVGLDGIPGTGDTGEGDGVPTAGDLFDITKPGEPNFEFTDIDESDQFGLTSFASPPFAGNRVSNDERLWDLVTPGRFDVVPSAPGDYVFLYGSGDFRLRAGDTKRFSIALIVGENRADLRLNADIAQQIYDVGYVFAKPPKKPNLKAAVGDRKVTLYWDDVAEQSVDPLTQERDFEGYVLYRSTDHEFSDRQTITDINGSKFLFSPLTTVRGVEAKFDLKNGITGASAIPYPGRGVSYDLGGDTGLFHTFVDSNNVVNGQTYYYAVTAYDRGYAGKAEGTFAGGIPPSETSKIITYDPTTDSFIYDVNSLAATPRPRVAGYVPPSVFGKEGLVRESGSGTGRITFTVVDPIAVRDGQIYRLVFEEHQAEAAYTIINEGPVTASLRATPGRSQTTGYRNLVPGTLQVRTADGRLLAPETEYTANILLGSIQLLPRAGVDAGADITATFQYAPLYRSTLLAGEEANLVFDGIHLFVDDDSLEVNLDGSGWVVGNADIPFDVRVASAGPGRRAQPFDYEIRFYGDIVGSSFNNNLPIPFEAVNLTQARLPIDVFAPDLNRNGSWDVDEQIIFLEMIDHVLTATWEGGSWIRARRRGTETYCSSRRASRSPARTASAFTPREPQRRPRWRRRSYQTYTWCPTLMWPPPPSSRVIPLHARSAESVGSTLPTFPASVASASIRCQENWSKRSITTAAWTTARCSGTCERETT